MFLHLTVNTKHIMIIAGLKHAILEGIYYSPTTLTDECKELINR